MTVLIAEDEPPTARALAALVAELLPDSELLGIASDGQQAIDLIDKRDPDLVITDIRMPVKTGIDVIRYCGARTKQPFIIVITGFKDFEYVQEALRYGAVDYVLKPIDPEDLAACFRRLAERKTGLLPAPLLVPALPGSPFLVTTDDLDFPLDVVCIADSRLCLATHAHLAGFLPVSELPGWLQLQSLIPNEASPLHFLLLHRRPGALDGPLPEVVLNRLALAQERATTVTQAWSVADTAHLSLVLSDLASQALLTSVFGRRGVASTLPDLAADQQAALRVVDTAAEAMAHAVMVLDAGELASVLEAVVRRLAKEEATSHRLFLVLHLFASRWQTLAAAELTGTPEADLAEKDPMESLLADTTYEELFSHLGDFAQNLCAQAGKLRSYYRPLMDSVDNFLAANITQPVTVQRIAAALGLDAEYLGKSFKKHAGLPLSRHIVAFRIARAREYMTRYPDALVKHVAKAVGFDDPLYFSRVFKAHTGKWPSEILASQ